MRREMSVDCWQSVTTKAKLSSCGRRSSSCTGYQLDPRQPCETYSVFGRRPSVDTNERSVVCVTDGRLVNSLGVSVQLDELSSLFVDKSVKSVTAVTLAINPLTHTVAIWVQL